MPSVPELKQAENGYWYVHWTEPGRRGERGRSKRVSTGTKEVAAAQVFFGQWLLMEKQAPIERTFTIEELWDVYYERYAKREVVGLDTLDYNWKNLKPHFGHLTLAEVTSRTVDDPKVQSDPTSGQGYIQKRQAGKIGRPSKLSTIRRELVSLMAAIHWCAADEQKIIPAAQVPSFKLPSDGEPRDRWLREDEVQRLFAAARRLRRGKRMSRGERFLWLALETAARKEAIWELTWDRVDFETGVLHYNKPGRRITKKRRASVPISKRLMPVLRQMHKEKINDHVLDNEAEVWKIVAGIAEAAEVPDVSPHVLRHTAATHMARRGVPLWKIAKILGNSLAMVERVYAKHCPDDLREAVDTISGGFLEAAE